MPPRPPPRLPLLLIPNSPPRPPPRPPPRQPLQSPPIGVNLAAENGLCFICSRPFSSRRRGRRRDGRRGRRRSYRRGRRLTSAHFAFLCYHYRCRKLLLHNSSVKMPPPRLILLFNSILSSVTHCRTNSSNFNSRSHLFRNIYSKNEMHNGRRHAHRRGRRRDRRRDRRRGRSII